MMNPLTWLARQRFPYEPLITVEISRSRLIHNLHEFQRIAPHGTIAPVLKSNAYGHGIVEVATILEREAKHGTSGGTGSIPFFVVDSYFEAVALRAKGIRTHILIIGYTRPQTMVDSKLEDVSYTISSIEQLIHLESIERPISLHLKIDTGMHRQGILEEEISTASDIISSNDCLVLRGICSHLCDSDNSDSSFTDGQITTWNRIAKHFEIEFSTLRYIHLSATDGHRYTGKIDANVSRLGIGLYGLTDGSVFMPKLNLLPVMSMKTIITGAKKLHRDQTVGYCNTFKADHEMTIATIPVGYFEGVDRRLSNIGEVQIELKSNKADQPANMISCPIIGKVSMDITSIDVSEIHHPELGMKVIVISDNPTNGNSIREIARKCNTIPYEIAVHIEAHSKRVVVE